LLPSELRESFAAASDDARFAMAVAAWAEVLKMSPFVSDSALDAIDDVLAEQAERDVDREELLTLFRAVR